MSHSCVFLIKRFHVPHLRVNNVLLEVIVTAQQPPSQEVLHPYSLYVCQRPVTWTINHSIIITHFISHCVMISFNKLHILYTPLRCFKDVLEKIMFCHVLGNPETYVMNVAWRKDTESLKLLINLKITFL